MINEFSIDPIVKIRYNLISEDNGILLKNAIEQLDNKQQYQLEIGKVLYGNGVKVGKYIVTPYNIALVGGDHFLCQISFCFGGEIYSTEYNSKFEPKEPIAIMQGYIFLVQGKFNSYEAKITRFDPLKLPTDIPLAELKAKVQWESFPVIIEKIPIHLNEQNTELENEYFKGYTGKRFLESGIDTDKSIVEVSNLGRVRIDNKIIKQNENNGLLYIFDRIGVHTLVGEVFFEKPFGVSSQIHHIDNNGYNNNISNLINVTMEQHTSIHPFMWDKYWFEDGRLRNY